MKINYEDIIALANQRKERLQQLEEALKDIDRIAAMLDEVAAWYGKVNGAFKSLDYEGKEMLPPEVKRLIPHLTQEQVIRSMVYFQNGVCAGVDYGLKALSKAMRG